MRSGTKNGTERTVASATVYAFEGHELDADRFELRRHGTRVAVQPKPLALLLYLARNGDRLVPREELVAHLWPDVAVSDDALFHALKVAREAVGDRGRHQRVIETVRGVGYRFVAPLEALGPDAARASTTRVRARPAAREPRPLVGRTALLDRLRAALDGALAGSGRVLFLAGEAGVGKTRLLDAVAAAARERGARVARGAGREAGGAVLAPWSEVLDDLLTGESDAELRIVAGGAAGGWLARLVPALGERLPAPMPEAPEFDDDTESRWRLYGAVARALTLAADRRPLVVVLDDLHWADVASLRLLEFVLGEVPQHAILVVAAYRDGHFERTDRLSTLVSEAVRLDAGESIPVEPLAEADVGTLLAEHLGARPAPELVRAVHARTEGNPFFVVQIARELAPRLASDPDAWRVALDGVPVAVRQVVSGRLARLGEAASEVLALAAIAGPEFDVGLVQRAWSGPPEVALDALEDAIAARLVEEPAGAPGRLRFVHALIHEAITTGLPGLRRARLHRAIGEALEARTQHDPDPPAATLAHHFLEAATVGGGDAAARWAVRAGDAAMRRAAYEEAAGQYDRALAWLDPASLEARPRYDLLMRTGRARHLGLGDYVRAREAFVGAAAAARALEDPARLAEAALAFAAIPQSSVLEVEEPCRRVLEEALAAQPEGAGLPRARLLARLGAFLANEPRRQAESVALAERALATAREVGDARTTLEALLALQRALRLQGTTAPERRLAIAEEGAAIADHVDDPVLATVVWGQRVAPLLELGRGDDADHAIDRFAESAERLRAPVFAWLVPILRASQQLLHGELARVEETARAALPIAARVPGSVAPGLFAVLLFALRREQDRLAELEVPFRALVAQYAAVPTPRAWLALLLAETGREEDARKEIEALATAGFGVLAGTEGWRSALAMLGDACVGLDYAAHGAALHAELLPIERSCLVLGDGVLCLGPAARVLGALDGLLGRWDDAEARFERALALCASLRSPRWEARTRLCLARMLLRRGRPSDRARALDILDDVGGAAERHAMARVAAEAQALRG
jgi:DNA-binding winged helix-turn-helix (wHTH) protein/tetratricopeptide (TPR) repeat protein